MYDYVEIAVGSPRNRGQLIAKKDLVNYIKPDTPLFRSVYLYDKAAIDYAESNGGLKNYFGQRGIDWILIDIDKGDNSDEYTLEKVRKLISDIDDMGVDINYSIQPYFSGSGYHLALPNSVFNFPSNDNLHYLVKGTLKSIFGDVIDSSIYMRTGIYRVQHTINKKTDLHKIPLTIPEILNKDSEWIREIAKMPRLEFAYSELVGRGELESKIVNRTPRMTQIRKVVEPRDVIPCVQEMLTNGPQEGNRNQTLLRIASHFFRHGVPSEYAKAAVLHWNNNSLNENSVVEKVEYVYNRGYRFGCQDEIMLKHCKTRCIHFKRKDYLIDVMSSDDLQSKLEERMSADFAGRSIPLADMLGVKDSDSEIFPGELVTIFGPTGSSKTTLAQCIALGVDFANDEINPDWQIPTLYLSLELSAWYMHRRNMQIVSGFEKEKINDNPGGVYKQHRDLLNHMVIQTIPPSLEQIHAKVKELRPALVVVDYIDLVETPPHVRGEYEQIKYISHSLSSMAVNNDLIIIQVSQVSREYSRNQVLDLYAGKGSGAIENASRKVIGLNGQANSPKKTLEVLKNTDGGLFKTNLEWQPSFRLRRTSDTID
tara:strand:- start:2620 stop:4407 length:1788 start_codon:yes stop_codon:yes gene_type:complete